MKKRVCVVKFRKEMLDYICKEMIKQSESKRIGELMQCKIGQYILLKDLKQVENILDIDLRKYIIKVSTLIDSKTEKIDRSYNYFFKRRFLKGEIRC